jgi:hypothetical protein
LKQPLVFRPKWTLNFDPAEEMPSGVLVWAQSASYPSKPIDGETLEEKGNKLEKFLDKSAPKFGI